MRILLRLSFILTLLVNMAPTTRAEDFVDVYTVNGQENDDNVKATYRVTLNGATVTRMVKQVDNESGGQKFYEGTIPYGSTLTLSYQLQSVSGTHAVFSYNASIRADAFKITREENQYGGVNPYTKIYGYDGKNVGCMLNTGKSFKKYEDMDYPGGDTEKWEYEPSGDMPYFSAAIDDTKWQFLNVRNDGAASISDSLFIQVEMCLSPLVPNFGGKPNGGRGYNAPKKYTYFFRLKVGKNAHATTLPQEKDTDVGPFLEVNTDAWGFDGPWPFAIPLSVIAGVLGYVLTRKGKNTASDKPVGQYKMHIYKDFDDSFIAGEQPKPVYARIVHILPDGTEMTEPTLTSMIKIEPGDNYMQVSDGGMQGEWRMAWVTAPEKDKVPEKGIVNFSVMSDTGGYMNHLHFRIEAGRILFYQDNLTLPAHYDKSVHLPFVVIGIPDGAPVEARILNSAGKPTDFYNVAVTWNAEKEVHEAVITDRKLDEKTDNGMPGNFIGFDLELKAKTAGGRVIETLYPVVRYYMGLAFKFSDEGKGNASPDTVYRVNSYLEEYNPQKHLKCMVGVRRNGIAFVPAENVGQLILYDYDEQKHEIETFAVVPERFSVRAIDEREDKTVQGLGLMPDFKDDKGNYVNFCVLRCMEASLHAPSRIDAVMTFEATIDNKKYTCDKHVLLCSQPYRTFQTAAAEQAAANADEETKRRLNQLIEHIKKSRQAERLLPIIKYIDNLIDGYEFRYGFDRSTIQFATAMYNHMLTERSDYTYDQHVPLSFADDLLECVRLTFDQYARPVVNATNKFNEKFGTIVLIGRIAIGFWTYGESEAFFRAYDALSLGALATNLTDVYIEEGTDGLTKNLKALAWEAGKMQIIMTGVQMGLGMGFGALRAKYNPRTSASKLITPGDIKPKTKPRVSKNQYASAKKGRITKEACAKSDQLQAKAKAEVNSPEAKLKTKGMKPERDLKLGEAYTDAKANRNIEDLHAIIEMCRENPTPENLALKRRLVIEVQADKTAMHKLRNLMDPDYIMVKAEFNREWYGINAKVDKTVINKLAEKYGISPEQIKLENVSSSKTTQLLEGKALTMDRDTTYYYVNARGEKVYFDQSLTDQIYKQSLHKEALGFEASSQELANQFGRKVDHTVIEDVAHHPESFGEDIGTLMNPNRHGESLVNPNKVADTITFKGADRFRSADMRFKMADQLTGEAKLQMERLAINDVKEGAYMIAKDGDSFVIPMDKARADVNGGLLVSDKLRRAIEHCRLVDTDNPIHVEELQLRLKGEGYNSFSEVAVDLGETFRRVGSPKLGVPTGTSGNVYNLNT